MSEIKYVVYRRLSKEDKSRTQHGFDSQMNDIKYFLDKEGCGQVIGDFKEFISGTAEHKPELEKAMQLCKEEKAVLLVAKLDRISRRVSQIARHMEGEIKFKVAALPNADNFQLHIYAALSEQERLMIADRVKRGLAAAKSKGVKLGAASDAYQQKLAQGKIKHVSKRTSSEASDYWEQQRPQIEHIITMMKASKTKLTFANICSNLNKMNITSREGKSLNPSQTQRILDKLNISRV
jgi:DNA invertase Pin-like site-specific DNA recombinase